MKLGLNAGNDGGAGNPAGGAPMGTAILDGIISKGYDAVRVGIPDDHANATAVLNELRPAAGVALYPIWLIAGGEMRRASGEAFTADELVSHVRDTCIKLRDFGYFRKAPFPAIEIGNEPDLAANEWKKNPEKLADAFSAAYDVAREYTNGPILSPSVSNLNKRGFRYLSSMLRRGLPRDAGIAFHRYPHNGKPSLPHPGFDSREEQEDKLLELADGRALWLTETGLSEGPHDGRYHSEERVEQAYRFEVDEWRRISAMEVLVWYNLNDGPDRSDILNNYGVRRMDGTWKPVAESVKSVRRVIRGA